MFGAAIDENGDLLQWGALYSTDQFEPTVTLKGKNLVSLVLSRDRIVALGKNGTVYSLPVPRADQESGPKPQESTWLPFRSVWSPISYRTIHPKALSWGERVCKISGGLEHVLLLTSSGRLFSAASASEDFPSQGPYDQAHEIGALRGFRISQIAAGDFHSLALDKDGRIFSFGSNAEGQLGLDLDTRAVTVDNPSLLPIQKLYNDTRFTPAVTGIAAGGANSFFTVDATPKVLPGEVGTTPATSKAVTADTFSCGLGIWGGLGNGRWTHVQRVPTKMKALSGLFEYDETKNQVIPIRLASISVGASHACAVMDNVTYVGAHERSSPNDTNWGADVLWWGNNEFYQLGTRRRNNISNPTYIPPLDTDAEREKGRREEHRFQITPRKMVSLNGRNVGVEQRVECGRNVSAVYSVV
ncbi:MAG: hypothetical protein M1826_005006 [Phylliscum demangeonii]|nr:MAG: hypothetical protein M1826_005006 [Phylliscum demangeonii]